MTIILGIDPGSRITGYGVINVVGSNIEYIDSGCIRVKGEELPERLHQIFESMLAKTIRVTVKQVGTQSIDRDL